MINKHALNQVSSIVTALCIALILSSVQAAEAPIQSPYTVNPGDILSISVWKEESLQRQVIIRPDGSFSFPLTGDILAAGQSIEQISQTVTEKLVKYIPDPVYPLGQHCLCLCLSLRVHLNLSPSACLLPPQRFRLYY